MNTFLSKKILTLLICLLALISGPLFANEKSETQKQIQSNRTDIKKLQESLTNINKNKSVAQKSLKRTELKISKLENKVTALQNNIKNSQKRTAQLEQKKLALQAKQAKQQKFIGQQARAVYLNSRQEYLKLLLNQKNPERISRLLAYYNYAAKSRSKQIEAFNKTIEQAAQLEQQITEQQKMLLTQKKTVLDQQSQLKKEKVERQQLVTQLNKKYQNKGLKLKAQKQEQAELNQVLKNIDARLARQAREVEARKKARAAAIVAAETARKAAEKAAIEAKRKERYAQIEQERKSLLQKPASTPVKKTVPPPKKYIPTPVEKTVSVKPNQVQSTTYYSGNFSNAKGKLSWPVVGRIIARYGSTRLDDSRAKWDGVLLAAAAKTPVHAVAGGRVVFADWLRGFGLLLIVNHGSGYLTLYGQNQSLLKKEGDLVKAGETISTVGSSGGKKQSALYFAIRQKGKAINPALWCR